MRQAAHNRSTIVALVAAVVLVAQSLLGAFTAGAAAHATALDAFGNPLCITSDDHGGAPGEKPAQLPNCCTLGCGMASLPLAAPTGGGLLLGPLLVRSETIPASATALVATPPRHGPQNPRAPPLTA